jgi:hypothetical protein
MATVTYVLWFIILIQKRKWPFVLLNLKVGVLIYMNLLRGTLWYKFLPLYAIRAGSRLSFQRLANDGSIL